ncbi:hypothetical protein V6N13_124450 [Hibiscus sabdariffa]|uniref:Reverse transcriptase domain-containing protein n=1 Tax=Hibiscus sabdariffa TaxID=183260 RepID=A0ABR2S1M8_9ROSI
MTKLPSHQYGKYILNIISHILQSYNLNLLFLPTNKGKQPKILTNDEEENINVEGTIFPNHTNEKSLNAKFFTNAPNDPADPTGHASTVVTQVDTIGVLSPTPFRVIKPPIENATDPALAKGVTPTDKADLTLEKDRGKSFQPTSYMLVEFEDLISKDSPINATTSKSPLALAP